MPPPSPPFDSLPLKKDGPRGNAWGLFGAADELGMLNRLTPENTLAAMKEVKHGIRVCTDWALDQPKAPCFNRAAFEHKIHHKAPRSVNDDMLSLNTQSSSQWDGFRHFGMFYVPHTLRKRKLITAEGYQDHKLYFNGCTQEDISSSHRNGTHGKCSCYFLRTLLITCPSVG
jgi:hypothetical protein